MAVPARHTSKTSKRMRQTHYKAEAKTVTKCPKCGAVIKPHRVCKECGYYKGKEVINKQSAE